MQLAGPGVFGPPPTAAPRSRCCATRSSWASTTSTPADSYGPYVTNEIIREALFPYPDDLHIVTKVGAIRDDEGGWLPARLARVSCASRCTTTSRDSASTPSTWSTCGVGGIDDRATPDSLAEPFERSPSSSEQGLIRHLGVSTVTAGQLAEAQQIAPVVCVQNLYNLANRDDDELIDDLPSRASPTCRTSRSAASRRCSRTRWTSVAARLGATPMAVALAWLLQRSPNILLIPGTSSVAHLRENIAGAALTLPPDGVADLDAI